MPATRCSRNEIYSNWKFENLEGSSSGDRCEILQGFSCTQMLALKAILVGATYTCNLGNFRCLSEPRSLLAGSVGPVFSSLGLSDPAP